MKSFFIALFLVLSFYLLNDNEQIDHQLSPDTGQLNLSDSVKAGNHLVSPLAVKNSESRLPEQFMFFDRESKDSPLNPSEYSDSGLAGDNVSAYYDNSVGALNAPYRGFSDTDSGDLEEVVQENNAIPDFDVQALENKLAQVSITNKSELFDTLFMALDHVDDDLRNLNSGSQYSQKGAPYIEVLKALSDDSLSNNDKELIVNNQLNRIDHEEARDALVLLETVVISLPQNETNEVIITNQLDQVQLMLNSSGQPGYDLPGPNWDYEYQQYSRYTNSLAEDSKSLGTDPAIYAMFFSDASDAQRMASLQQVSLLVEKQMGFVR